MLITTDLSFHCYECADGKCEIPDEKLSVCKTIIGCFKSSVKELGGIGQSSRGCILTPEQDRDICSNVLQAKGIGYRYKCCEEELCNSSDFLVPDNSENYGDIASYYLAIIILGTIVIIMGMGIAIATIYYYKCRDRPLLNRVTVQQRQPEVISLDVIANAKNGTATPI
ncbi:uncharacterized protein LOC131672538 [Phymastichus coffea]|uniref:uncharacterized protein LOC131672538 n=1 Tax=Phymastichus coffea TaxID=108790 RepID=UPI00273BCE2D|nr:uncharacterized protein LOC131672538 [Phymastichus coffea]